MAIRLVGYRRLPGTARRYVTPQGQEISYQEYRRTLEKEQAVEHLPVEKLAMRRLSQRRYNDIIAQIAKVKREAIDKRILEIEYLADEGILDEDDVAEEIEALRYERRTARRAATVAPSRKQAMQELKTYGKERARARREHRPIGEEANARMVDALKALGRREGVPDYVPVGESDVYRRGRLAVAA